MAIIYVKYGLYDAANREFDEILAIDANNSDLKPNAQSTLGISQGGMGDIPASKKTLQTFVNDNPGHPLVADAKRVIAEIGGYTCKKDNAAVAC